MRGVVNVVLVDSIVVGGNVAFGVVVGAVVEVDDITPRLETSTVLLQFTSTN